MHGNRILSPNPKSISSVTKLSEYFDEKILEKVNNKYYTPTEFNNALNELSTKKTLYMHLNISSLSYHHLELYNLIADMKIKPKIIGISESRLQKSKQHITNIFLSNYVYEHTYLQNQVKGVHSYTLIKISNTN